MDSLIYHLLWVSPLWEGGVQAAPTSPGTCGQEKLGIQRSDTDLLEKPFVSSEAQPGIGAWDLELAVQENLLCRSRCYGSDAHTIFFFCFCFFEERFIARPCKENKWLMLRNPELCCLYNLMVLLSVKQHEQFLLFLILQKIGTYEHISRI